MKKLKKNNVLISIDKSSLNKHKAHSTVHLYNKGDYVFQAGEIKNNFYLLIRGRVKLYRVSSHGREMTQWFCFPGEVFGLSELQTSNQLSVNAQCSEDSEILSIPLSQFNNFIKQSPDTALQIIQQLSIRLKIVGDTLLNYTSDDVKTRLIKLLVRLNMRYGINHKNGMLINLVLTHKEIADMIGGCRQTVTTILGELKKSGDIQILNHHIFIQSPLSFERLTKLSNNKVTNRLSGSG